MTVSKKVPWLFDLNKLKYLSHYMFKIKLVSYLFIYIKLYYSEDQIKVYQPYFKILAYV